MGTRALQLLGQRTGGSGTCDWCLEWGRQPYGAESATCRRGRCAWVGRGRVEVNRGTPVCPLELDSRLKKGTMLEERECSEHCVQYKGEPRSYPRGQCVSHRLGCWTSHVGLGPSWGNHCINAAIS